MRAAQQEMREQRKKISQPRTFALARPLRGAYRVGMQLREYLKAHSLTLEQFGELAGRSAATMSRIAAGKQWPDGDTVAAIEAASNGDVTVADIWQTYQMTPADPARPAASEPEAA